MAISTPIGVKRICPSCNSRFYDLNKPMAHCPKCGHEHDPALLHRPRRAKRVTSGPTDQDLLTRHMERAKAGMVKPKKEKEAEEEFGGGAVASEPGLEEIEDIDDLKELEEIEEPDDEESEDEAMEEKVGGAILIDTVEEEAEEEESEDEARPASKQKQKKKR